MKNTLIQKNKKQNFTKMILVAAIVGITAQIYISILITNFMISFAIILFPVFLFSFEDINTTITGIFAALFVYLLRIIFTIFNGGLFIDAAYSYFPEIFFYSSYAVLFSIFYNKFSRYGDLNKFFLSLVFCDFSANFVELFIRSNCSIDFLNSKILSTLILVAIIRSSIIWIVLNTRKYYRLLLLKEEHENRYKKLLWMTSKLKTEMYWMNKSMNNIEKVMSDAYDLYENISSGSNPTLWSNKSVNIAKDIHEIKKEYSLVMRGIEELTENKLQDKGMHFKEIITILQQSFTNELKHRKLNIKLTFKSGEDFFTDKHYYLMSIFRNLMMNAIDAIVISNNTPSLSFIHETNDNEEVFIIKDTGSGIKTEDLNYIFSPGFSTKIDYTTGNINRGLGLSIVKDIVEKTLNGRIEVDSVLEKGTCFKIYILKNELEVK